MNEFRKGWWVVVSVALSAAAVALWQRHMSLEMRSRLDGAQNRARDLRVLQAEHQKLTRTASVTGVGNLNDAREALERSREELKRLKDLQHLASAPGDGGNAAGEPEAENAKPFLALGEMRNAGRATARQTGETFIWTLQNGDIEGAAGMIAFVPEARKKIEAILSTLPENIQTQYGTPEKLTAFVLAGSRNVAALRIVSETNEGSSEVVQKIQTLRSDGAVQEDFVRFQRDTDGWRRVISPQTADRLVNFLKQRPRPDAKK